MGRRLPVVLLAALTLACASKRKELAQAGPEPEWRSEDGKAEAQLVMVDTLLDNGSPEAALQLVQQLRKDGVEGHEVEVAHGRALRDLGLLEDARLLLVEASTRYPRQAEVHAQLGVLYLDLRDLDAAIASLERASRLAPESADIQNNLGFALLTAGRTAEAVDALREALRLDGTRPRTRNNLGYALVADGREDEALRVFQSSGRPADAHYQVGLGLELRGDADEARLAYGEALSHDPNHTHAREALQRLAAPPAPPESP